MTQPVDIPLPPAHEASSFVALAATGISRKRAYHTICSVVVPRPIAFVSTLNEDGSVNAAPFSFFTGVTANPPTIAIAVGKRDGQRKDTSRNIVRTGELVVNVCSVDSAQAINVAASEFPPEVSEVELTGLATIPSVEIATPRVANALVQMECRLERAIPVGHHPGSDLILARIVQFHIHQSLLDADGRIDVAKLDPLARLAGTQYAALSGFFNVPRGISEDAPPRG